MTGALPNLRVFVIQFSQDADPARGRLVGRVEHVDSGRNTRFASAAEMNEFFAYILREIDDPGTTSNRRNCGEDHSRRSR